MVRTLPHVTHLRHLRVFAEISSAGLLTFTLRVASTDSPWTNFRAYNGERMLSGLFFGVPADGWYRLVR